MITEERERAPAPGGPPPPPPTGGGREWWREWPAPFNRPRPINRGNLLRGGLVAVPFLVLVDGFLGAMAWYATGNVVIGAAVFAVTFLFTLGEVALVAWAAGKRQEAERRRGGPTG